LSRIIFPKFISAAPRTASTLSSTRMICLRISLGCNGLPKLSVAVWPAQMKCRWGLPEFRLDYSQEPATIVMD
jgi:hypothetical protein